MPKTNKKITLLVEIIDPKKRLICGILKQAVFDYQHPKQNPQGALDASIFLLDAREWAVVCGLKVDESRWEKLIASL